MEKQNKNPKPQNKVNTCTTAMKGFKVRICCWEHLLQNHTWPKLVWQFY